MPKIGRGHEVAIPAIRWRDSILLPAIAVNFVVAVCVPVRYWRRIFLCLARLLIRLRSGRRATLGGNVATALDIDPAGEETRRIVEQNVRCHQEERHIVLRAFGRPKWRPPLTLDGREHLDRALAERRGAILWIAPFLFAGICAKWALSSNGYQLTHLSRVNHGFANSRVCIATVNRIWLSVENRMLRERLVMDPGRPGPALRRLHRRLGENRIVSIAAGPQGLRQVTVPFLNGSMTVASGAPAIALSSHAPILPLTTVRTDDGVYRTRVLPALDMPSQSRRERQIVALVEIYAEAIEDTARKYPEQFFQWR